MQGKSYFAAVLTQESRAKLLTLCPAKHEVVRAHHLTVAYNVDAARKASLVGRIGEKVGLIARWHFANGRCQAVYVEGFDSDNKYPHITISRIAEARSFESNELIAQEWPGKESIDIALEAIFEYIENDNEAR